REAFGKPLRAQQAVGFPLVEDWAHLDATWLYVDHALARLEAGENVVAESALAKRMATDVALGAIDHAIQFHGGRGYSSALPHEQRWRDVRSGAIAHGPSEVMLRVAASRLWPRAGPTSEG
ncbi:MAG: acyl-CoA/acyl-ACP dehydrogenase, partial [Thermoplasmata archaeon]|nr:acyl-CoA/acyl-ACP dehydrogenase [Thermoplasmata archaeon]